jgi:aromatic-L-amino-acid decarboxylase
MRGIGRADSITLDPHKGLFLPYGTGSLLVRDGEALKRAHQLSADYLPAMQEDPDLVDFCLYSPELSRDFRGLRVWLPIKMHGIGTFRRNLEEKLELTRWATEQLRKIPEIEILAEPQLSIVAFRLNRPGLDLPSLNRLNQLFLEKINGRKRVFLTGTKLGGAFALRICVLSFRTHLDRMQQGLEDIEAAARQM